MKPTRILTATLGAAALVATSLAAGGTPAVASVPKGAGTVATDHRADPGFSPRERKAAIAAASDRVTTSAKALRLGSKEKLVVKDVVRDSDGAEHIRYERTYDGLPVIGGDLVVHQTRSGVPKTVDWASHDAITVSSTTPTVAARSLAGSGAKRVIWAAQHKPVLAWQTRVTGTAKDGTPIDDLVYTDARTGKRLGVQPQVFTDAGTGNSLYSGTVGITTKKAGTKWTLIDASRGNQTTYNLNGGTSGTGALLKDADNVWGNGRATSPASAAVDAHYGGAMTWDFYKLTFGRNGIRNDGIGAYSRVHYGSGYENAFWDNTCFCMTYGDGASTFKPLVAIDVAGHEMSHGVTSETDGLDYFGDAGGLNESTSDVMGTMVEFYANNASDPGDYYIGEKIMKDGTYLRRMDTPSLDGSSVNCYSGSVANLDPHFSSGVGNHLFYLLSEGSGGRTIGGRPHSSAACNGAKINGIGRDAAAAIWYRAMTVYWTSSTTYPQAANGMVKAAKDLYGLGSSNCNRTILAWKGVSITPTENCTTPTGGGDTSNPVKNPGFEAGDVRWTTSRAGIITNSPGAPARHGSYKAWLNGFGSVNTDVVSQAVKLPATGSAMLRFHVNIGSQEGTGTAFDTLTVRVTPTGGSPVVVKTLSNRDNTFGAYELRAVDLTPWINQVVTISFTGVEDSSFFTAFLLDDIAVTNN